MTDASSGPAVPNTRVFGRELAISNSTGLAPADHQLRSAATLTWTPGRSGVTKA